MSTSNNEDIVLAIILRKPTHAAQIAKETGISRLSVGSIIGGLVARNAIERIGTAGLAGMKNVKPSLAVWAAPGTPPLRAASERTDSTDTRIAGRITHGRGSFWGAGIV